MLVCNSTTCQQLYNDYIHKFRIPQNSTMVDKHKQGLKTSDLTYTVHVWLEQLHHC